MSIVGIHTRWFSADIFHSQGRGAWWTGRQVGFALCGIGFNIERHLDR